MPVPFLLTETWSHRGQVWAAREIFSISFTRFRINLPYLGPKRPALPDTFPFALFLAAAMS
jgi:hypothetical protein